MTSSTSDLLKVIVLTTGTNTLLGCDCSSERHLFLTQEYALELHHARISEQQCGIVLRYKRGTLSSRVTLFLEEFEKLLPDLGGRHGVTLRENYIY